MDTSQDSRECSSHGISGQLLVMRNHLGGDTQRKAANYLLGDPTIGLPSPSSSLDMHR